MQKDIRNPYYEKYESISDGRSSFIPIGMPTLANMTNDFETGKVTVITGPPKEGKSSVLHQIFLNAIDKGFGAVLLDGEHDQSWLLNSLYRKVIGNTPRAYTSVPYNKKHIFEFQSTPPMKGATKKFYLTLM
jgi:RecA/RadA recombinase